MALAGNEAFQLLTGPDFDGRLDRGNSLSNFSGEAVDFSGTESPGGSLGVGTPGSIENSSFAYDLRAVPEPSAFIPAFFVIAFGIFLATRSLRRKTATEAL